MQVAMTAIALVVGLHLVGAELQEVAYTKPGTQAGAVYSTPELDAARITDGDSSSHFGYDGTCSLVPRMIKPWITIDLEKTFYVDRVTLFMRGDSTTAIRDTNIEVRVGSSPDYEDNAVCGFKAGYFGARDDLKCPELLPGRYVTVFRNDEVDEYLQVCEMQVYAETGYISSCICWGDPHCRSFDLAPWLHYQGSCSYIMFRDNCLNGLPNGDPSVEVIIDAKKPSASSSVSLVRTVHIKLHDYDMTITIHQGRVTTVNGVTVQGTPYHPNDKVSITTTGGYVYVTVENGVRVRYDGVYNAYVDIPRMLAEKVCGICGNADGNPNNDWMVGPSKDCMDNFPNSQPGTISSNLNEVGNSWLAYIDEDPTCPIECPEPPPPPGCTTASHQKAIEHCEILNDPNGPFATCLNAMPEDQREGYFDNCVYDSCALEIYDTIVCTYAKGLAEECAKVYDMEITWRTDSFCPLPCPAGMIYKTCTHPCMPTCTDLNGEECGIPEEECEEGCFCKEGMVFDGEKCVSESTCGCHYAEQDVIIAVGGTFTTNDCSQTCECKTAGGELDCTDTSCTQLESCTKQDGQPTCECNEGNIIVDGICRHPSFACTLPKDRGQGSETLVRYFFNQDKCLCKQFEYKGEEGNANNFKTLKDCKNNCNEFQTPLECLDPFDKGTCDDKIIKFYYNKDTDLCKKLYYTGCGGSDNRFDSKEECRKFCKRC